MLKPGDIVQYEANIDMPVFDKSATGYVGVVSEAHKSDDGEHFLARVEWLYAPPNTHSPYRICYQENLRKLGEVQHG